MSAAEKKSAFSFLWIYLFFLLVSLFLFSPVLHKNFASDDFSVLYRLIYQHKIFIKDFFRPLSDISLYFSYIIGGFDPFAYNVFNVVIHASCTYMLYRFCLMRTVLIIENQSFFAWCSALLFLIYPFHNESVVWVVGRASMMSCFFGFLSLLTAFSEMPHRRKYLLSCIFYFIGLCGYETILPLPCIVLLLLYKKGTPLRDYVAVALGYAVTLVGNMIIRYLVSGVLWGSYGGKMFSPKFTDYLTKFFKTAGRLLLPPGHHSLLLSVCFVILVIIISTISIVLLRKKGTAAGAYSKITGALCLSCIVPLMFGISTRTFEGDRLFYFTSFFLCIWIGYLFQVIKQVFFRRFIAITAMSYFLFFFYQSIYSWRQAGNITTAILQQAGNLKKKDRNLVLINLPEEYNGAQVFRNGFAEALLLQHMDTEGIKVINYLVSEDAELINNVISPLYAGDRVTIAPHVFISGDTITARIRANAYDTVRFHLATEDMIYYWNKEAFIPLNNPLKHAN
jgi:protein O-mannosyl-transferase